MTTTNGIFELVSLEALTIPVATTSALAIPANKFTNIISTSLSSIIILKAAIIFSSFADPPISKKLAGSAPAHLVRSIVAIAKPAPFTIQPTFPISSFTYDKSYVFARDSNGDICDLSSSFFSEG